MKKPKEYLTLWLEFVRFGTFTFGGAFSIISQMQELYVEKKHTLTSEELLDTISVAKSIPGTMIGNVAMMYGYHACGLLGGILAVAGMCAPPMLVLIVISFGYEAFRDSYWVSATMEGIQAAVVPIIASAALGMVKGSIRDIFGIAVMLAAIIMYVVLEASVLQLILMGMVSGLVFSEIRARKEAKGHGAA